MSKELTEGNGVYTLLVFVPVERHIVVSRWGEIKFPEGYYAYTGSAFGKGAMGLSGRISRHLSKNKRKRWHIDYLLSNNKSIVIAAFVAYTKEKIECGINRYLRDKLQAKISVPGFGSSDCKTKCGSHLLYLGKDENNIRKITELYFEKIDGKIIVLNFH